MSLNKKKFVFVSLSELLAHASIENGLILKDNYGFFLDRGFILNWSNSSNLLSVNNKNLDLKKLYIEYSNTLKQLWIKP